MIAFTAAANEKIRRRERKSLNHRGALCCGAQNNRSQPPPLKTEGLTIVVQLVLIYCLSKDSLSCVERRPMLEVTPSPMGCIMAAQPLAAQYLEEHPAYKLSSWRCEISNRPERAA
jgi:hypothetical protein